MRSTREGTGSLGLCTGEKAGVVVTPTTTSTNALEDNWTLEKRVSCDQRWCLRDILWFYRTPDNPILDRKRKTDWLTDIQIANIQGLLWESQKAGIWDRNPGLSVYFQYPSTLALVIGDLSKHTGNYLRVTADNSVLFTIINRGGNHWVLLVLDNITTKRALYFDSLGQDIPETLCTAHSALKAFELYLWTEVHLDKTRTEYSVGLLVD